MSIKHQGSCLCGGVRLPIQGPLAPIQVCHCPRCRRAQGGPVAANTPVEAPALLPLHGEGSRICNRLSNDTHSKPYATQSLNQALSLCSCDHGDDDPACRRGGSCIWSTLGSGSYQYLNAAVLGAFGNARIQVGTTSTAVP